jgi:predicted CopG family antitoxin
MKTPFAIFRKHQKVLMAFLTGLSMFAFVVMDSLRQDSSGASIPILCGVIGMAIFGIIGWRRGEAITFGAVGIAVGVVLGIFLMLHMSSGPKPPIETDAGNLTRAELNNLITRRNTANQFVRLAIEKADIAPALQNNPMFAQMIEQQIRRSLFGFGHEQNDISEDVVLGFLLDKEADDMGIVVSEQAVSDFINRVTNKKLTSQDFASVLKSMRLSESEVFDAIRGELKARLAMEMLMPRAVPSPAEYWDQYQKLQVTETLDVAAVPVSDFLSAAPNPTEDQLLTYFDAWKQIPAAYPGAQGLRQPRRVRVEYLQADFSGMEKEIAKKPITDQEIKKYYDDHHEEYRNHPAAGSTPSTAPSGPSLTLPGLTKTPAAPKTAAPAKKHTTTQPKTAPHKPHKTEAKPNAKSGTFNDRKARKPGEPEGEMLALADWRNEPVQLAVADDANEPPAPALPQPPHAKPAAPGQHNPPQGNNKTPLFSSTTKASESPEPEFRPLDEILKREIRDQILRTRTQAAMKEKIEAAFDFLQSLREQLTPAEIGAAPKMSDAQRQKKVSEYAAQHQLTYVLTPLLSAEELHNSAEKYPIAEGTEPVEDQFQQRAPVQVMQTLFLTSPELLYEPYRAEDGESHRFAYWKVEDVADHVPTLKDPGVREEAVRGWKIAEFAQKKAKERADALADMVRKSKQAMPEALAGQKVTKSDKGPALVVVPTPPFSWYTVQSTAPRDLMPDPSPRLSDIAGVSNPDDAFMKAVFDEMKVNDVRVVANRGPTAFYVVKLKSRHPADEAEKEAFRARFLKERLFSSGFMFGGRTTYDYLNMPEQQQLAGDWMERLYTKYNVRRNMEEQPPQHQPRRAG